MRKAQITKLIELTHVSYTREFTDEEAEQYSRLQEEYDNWVEGISNITYDKMFAKFAYMFNEVEPINLDKVWKTNLKNQWGYSYNSISSMLRATLKAMIKTGKAVQIKNTHYEILKPLRSNPNSKLYTRG